MIRMDKKQLSLINKRAEEGDGENGLDKLPSQFLSKQSRTLIKKQLNLAAADKQSEFDEICSLTNPTVKKALLKSFADDCDARQSIYKRQLFLVRSIRLFFL